jgi:hypothetical protein
MAFNLLSKNILGSVTTLVLVILLTQARFFDFLINTPLGRTFLIIAILGISCCHKIFGVVAILFVIIIFNQSEFGFMEGFTDPSGNSVTDVAILQKKKEASNKVDELDQLTQRNVATISSSSAAATNPIPTETFIGREGSNIIERESMLLRGKRSNEVPVFSRNQSDNVVPSEEKSFNNLYTSI